MLGLYTMFPQISLISEEYLSRVSNEDIIAAATLQFSFLSAHEKD
jgi:hypothetical protein